MNLFYTGPEGQAKEFAKEKHLVDLYVPDDGTTLTF